MLQIMHAKSPYEPATPRRAGVGRLSMTPFVRSAICDEDLQIQQQMVYLVNPMLLFGEIDGSGRCHLQG